MSEKGESSAMLRVRDRRARIVIVLGLLLVIGYAIYQVGASAWASYQLQLASEALEHYDYRQAGVHLTHYLSIHPGDATVCLLTAQTTRRRGDFDEAMKQLRLAEKHGTAPQAIRLERQLARIQAGDLSEIGSLMEHCSDHPDQPETALILEVIIEGSLKTLQVPLAKWAVDLWLAHRTGNYDQAQGLCWRGRVNEFSQDFPQALADYRRAVELAPDHRLARVRLAEMLLREEPREAVPHLEWLRSAYPEDTEVQFLTARLYRGLGRPEEAGRLLDAIFAVGPPKFPVTLERARVALDLHRTDEAERWARTAVELAPQDREANVTMADSLLMAGRLNDAKIFQDRAVEIQTRLEQKLKEYLDKAGK
jgi:tetratricopeptide (TPR) repeat protein